MQKGASRPGAWKLDNLRNPHIPSPCPIIHRTRRKPRWYEDNRLRGREYWKGIGCFLFVEAALLAIWWFGGM